MRVLVTGAGGFVGANLVERLAELGIDCVGMDVRRGVLGEQHALVEGDILDDNHLDRIVPGVDTVVHLAVSNLRTSLENPRRNLRINVEGTLNLLEAARKHGVRKIIYSSASSVYGVPRYSPVDEDHPKFPKTVYGLTKYTGEHLLRLYHELHGIDYFVFRFTNVYGPRQQPSTGGLIPVVLTRLAAGQPVTVYGSGEQTRDFVFVHDVVRLLARTVQPGAPSNVVVNVGSGVQTSIAEVVRLCSDALGVVPTVQHMNQEAGERQGFQADLRFCQQVFGELPATMLRDGIAQTASWLATA